MESSEIKNECDISKLLNEEAHICQSESPLFSGPHFCAYCGVFLSKAFILGNSDARTCRSPNFKKVNTLCANTSQVLNLMLDRQSKNRIYITDFQQYDIRKKMQEMAETFYKKLKFCKETIASAKMYIDAFLTNYNFDPRHTELLSCLCVLFAAKLSENNDNILTNQDLKEYLLNEFELEEIDVMEMGFFKAFGFNLVVQTPLDFLNFYLSKGVVCFKELGSLALFGSLPFFMQNLENEIIEFLFVIQTFYEMNQFSSSVLAAVAISCGRSATRFKFWTFDLEEMSGVLWSELFPALKHFMKILELTKHQKRHDLFIQENLMETPSTIVHGSQISKNTSLEQVISSKQPIFDKNHIGVSKTGRMQEKENIENRFKLGVNEQKSDIRTAPFVTIDKRRKN